MWNIVKDVDPSIKNIQYVFPLKQRMVEMIVRTCEHLPHVKRVIIFGSSVSYRCNPHSDIDVYFDTEELMYGFKCNNGIKSDEILDVWSNATVEPELMQEILETGVVVYERVD